MNNGDNLDLAAFSTNGADVSMLECRAGTSIRILENCISKPPLHLGLDHEINSQQRNKDGGKYSIPRSVH